MQDIIFWNEEVKLSGEDLENKGLELAFVTYMFQNKVSSCKERRRHKFRWGCVMNGLVNRVNKALTGATISTDK